MLIRKDCTRAIMFIILKKNENSYVNLGGKMKENGLL